MYGMTMAKSISISNKLNFIFLIFTFIFISNLNNLISQQTDYIIPDIGAPGMGIYVEAVAKFDDNNFFGSDGFNYDNNSNVKFKIELEQPLNSNLITFGPATVSFNGRLLSTYIYVNPDAKPSSWEWDKSGTFVIFGVYINNNRVAEYRFDIVQPFAFGDKSGVAEYILGQGQLGKRSRRGVMIVDSMILSSTNIYTVSKTDCDAGLAGNQAYLPFTLISKGPIKSKTGTTTINVNSTGLDGGVGGGGGGGSFCDIQVSGGFGTNGGDGFTGGGPGGQNGTFLAVSQRKNGGNGSGNVYNSTLGGGSINLVQGGNSTTSFESSGGGTGFPFGSSGKGCITGVSCNEDGGYGGGSGYQQVRIGGHAGHTIDGTTIYAGANTAGKAYGNQMCIPLSGGSGGASGNPQGLAVCAGAGGGGGGAIRILGQRIENVIITANGANGLNGIPDGGSGSGGTVDFHTKLGFNGVSLSASGGSNASNGRIRINTFSNTSLYPTIVNAVGTNYLGFSIDTTTYFSNLKFTITGSADYVKVLQPGKLRLYIKQGNSPDWISILAPNTITADGRWTKDIDLTPYKDQITANNKYFYLAGVVDATLPIISDPYRDEPEIVLSLSAANVLISDLQPEILTQKRPIKKVVSCGEGLITDSLWVTNIGFGSLSLDLVNDWVRGNQGFSLVSPVGANNIFNEDSVYVKFTFDPKGKTNGIYRDSLKLFTNMKGNNGQRFLLVEYDFSKFSLIATDLDGKDIDTLDLGTVCIGGIANAQFRLKNVSQAGVSINKIDIDTDFVLSSGSLSTYLPNQDKVGQINFTKTNIATGPNGLISTVRFFIAECPTAIDSLILKVVVGETNLIVQNTIDTDFGDVFIGKELIKTIKIVNNGNIDALIEATPLVNPPFTIRAIRPMIPVRLKQGDTLELDIAFTPTLEQDYSNPSSAISKGDGNGSTLSCATNIDFTLTGRGVKVNYEFPKDIDFGNVLVCADNKDTIITIVNKNTKKVKLKTIDNGSGTQIAEIILDSTNPDDFKVVATESLAKEYNFNDTIRLKATFDSKNKTLGPKIAKATINLIYPDNNQTDKISINLTGNIEGLSTQVIPNNTLNFGDMPLNVNFGPRKVTIKNTGNITKNYSFTKNEADVTIVPNDFTLLPGGEIEIEVYYISKIEGTFNKTLTLKENDCNLTFDLIITGKSIKSDVSVQPTNLDFGFKSPCSTDELFIDIFNKGVISVTVVSFEIDGKDKGYFSLVNNISNFTLDSAKNTRQTIRFSNPARNKGVFEANVKVTINENGQDITYNIPIKVEVISGFGISPIELDFGAVIVNQNKVLSFDIKRTQNWAITTSNVTDLNGTTPFSYDINSINGIIVPNVDLPTNITFSPTVVGPYNEVINIEYIINNDINCRENVTVTLKGSGVPAAKVEISTEVLTFDPTVAEVKIPVYIQITGGVSEVDSIAIDTLAISYNYTQFYPKSAEFGNIRNSEITDITNNIATTYIYTEKITITTNKVNLVNLVGTPLLGNTKQDVLTIGKIIFNKKDLISEVTKINGSITTTICQEGGDRLLQNSAPMKLSINEDISNNSLNIICEMIEIGKHSVDIYDILGNLVYNNIWDYNPIADINTNPNLNPNLNTNPNQNVLSLDKNLFNNGAYMFIYKSNNRTKTGKYFIYK